MFYLNNAGTSWPKPEPVKAAIAEAMLASPKDWEASFEKSHQSLASYFGVDHSRLLMTPGCTQALSLAAQYFMWQPGDVILTSSFEHQALIGPLALLHSQGVNIKHIPPGKDTPFCLEALEVELGKNNVRMLAMTAACNVTGEQLPYRDAIKIAQKHSAITLLDLAQLAGWQRLNLTDIGADICAIACHKGMSAPWGMGLLYVAKGVPMTSDQASCSIHNKGSCSPMPTYCNSGSVDRLALAGLTAAVGWLETQETAKARTRVYRMWQESLACLTDNERITILRPHTDDPTIPTIAFRPIQKPLQDVYKQLKKYGIVASVGHQCAPLAHRTLNTQELGGIRLSFGHMSDSLNLGEVLSLLEKIG